MQVVIEALASLSLAAILRFLMHEAVRLEERYLIDPLTKQFFSHALLWARRLGHPHRNAFKCPDCKPFFYNLPQ